MADSRRQALAPGVTCDAQKPVAIAAAPRANRRRPAIPRRANPRNGISLHALLWLSTLDSPLSTPPDRFPPDREALGWHREVVFRSE